MGEQLQYTQNIRYFVQERGLANSSVSLWQRQYASFHVNRQESKRKGSSGRDKWKCIRPLRRPEESFFGVVFVLRKRDSFHDIYILLLHFYLTYFLIFFNIHIPQLCWSLIRFIFFPLLSHLKYRTVEVIVEVRENPSRKV